MAEATKICFFMECSFRIGDLGSSDTSGDAAISRHHADSTSGMGVQLLPGCEILGGSGAADGGLRRGRDGPEELAQAVLPEVTGS